MSDIQSLLDENPAVEDLADYCKRVRSRTLNLLLKLLSKSSTYFIMANSNKFPASEEFLRLSKDLAEASSKLRKDRNFKSKNGVTEFTVVKSGNIRMVNCNYKLDDSKRYEFTINDEYDIVECTTIHKLPTGCEHVINIDDMELGDLYEESEIPSFTERIDELLESFS